MVPRRRLALYVDCIEEPNRSPHHRDKWEKRNQGALHRMVDSIVACGLCPVIVGPVSPHMLGILRHWSWHREVVDDGEEGWRPQIIDGKIEPWGSGRSG